jgi:hypothetical protein
MDIHTYNDILNKTSDFDFNIQFIEKHFKHKWLNISRILNPFTNFGSKKWTITKDVAHI